MATTRPSLCPQCRKLVGIGVDNCHHCGASLGAGGRTVHGILSWFRSEDGVTFWHIMLGLNVALYVMGLAATVLSGEPIMNGVMGALGASDSVQLRMGLQTTGLIDAGQWWRLVTCTFLHAGILHLGFNMYFLLQLGPHAHRMFGNWGFLILYVLGGVAGSITEYVLGNPVLGASGSIMAMLGALAGEGIIRHKTWRNPLTQEMLRIIAYVTVFGMVIGSVAHGAHIGGFVGGCALLFLLAQLTKQRLRRLFTGAAYGTAVLVIMSLGMMAFTPQPADPREATQCVMISVNRLLISSGPDDSAASALDALDHAVRQPIKEPPCLRTITGETLPAGVDELIRDLSRLYAQRRGGVDVITTQTAVMKLVEERRDVFESLGLRFGDSPGN